MDESPYFARLGSPLRPAGEPERMAGMKTFLLILRCSFGGLLGLILAYLALCQITSLRGHFLRSEWLFAIEGIVLASIFGIFGFLAIREAVSVAKRIRTTNPPNPVG